MSRFEEALRRLEAQDEICVDVETSGLDWKRNHIVGYVLTFGPAPQDSYYLPFRHKPGGNIEGVTVPQTTDGWDGTIHPMERFIVSQLSRKDKMKFGHNFTFDMKFMFRQGLQFEGRWEDTMISAPLLNEWQSGFSLDVCGRLAGVQAKKLDIYAHIEKMVPEARGKGKGAMGYYWCLAGDDPVGVEYAEGDGTTTWQLRHKQVVSLLDQELSRVHDVECRLIPVLARMMTHGIRVDEERLMQVKGQIASKIEEALRKLPDDFNSRAPSQVQKLVQDAGYTDWPLTPTGRPSFPESWLIKNPVGQNIVAVRKWSNLLNSFIEPMIETHLFKGRVHPEFNQLRGDDYGTITGRLSSSNPNMQQANKRNEEIGRIHRSIFVPELDHVWGSVDYSQCLAKGSKVMVPGGTKNIEDMVPGDLVYSYDASRRLVLKKVTWAGQTGVRELCRVRWNTNGRTKGFLDVTSDHKLRLLNGTYKTVSDLAANPLAAGHRSRYPYMIRLLALRRGVTETRGDKRNYLWITGKHRVKESRFVFEQVNGWLPENVHHMDGNSLNDVPSNLEGLTDKEHRTKHMPYGFSRLTKSERIKSSRRATEALRKKFKLVNNHYITHIIPLPGAQPVYDITVEDTHNFIANEICVHNCEPRLLAYYSRSEVLLNGYRKEPFEDAHTSVAKAMTPDWEEIGKDGQKQAREVGKRINQTLITGGGKKVLVSKYGVDPDKVDFYWSEYFKRLPEIKPLQKRGEATMRERGYVLSLLKRRARLNDPSKAYTAVNRLLQCGNADVLKLKMVEIDDYLASEGRPLHLLNNVHDAIDFSFAEDNRKHYDRCLQIMTSFGPEDMITLDVPMVVEAGEGENWAVATFGPEKC